MNAKQTRIARLQAVSKNLDQLGATNVLLSIIAGCLIDIAAACAEHDQPPIPPLPPEPETETARCEPWLLAYLRDHGPSSSADVVQAAELEGFSPNTVYRTRRRLRARIGNTKAKRAPGNEWYLIE